MGGKMLRSVNTCRKMLGNMYSVVRNNLLKKAKMGWSVYFSLLYGSEHSGQTT